MEDTVQCHFCKKEIHKKFVWESMEVGKNTAPIIYICFPCNKEAQDDNQHED